MNQGLKKNKAFTLIELLVVVAIISLLTSIVFAALNSARVKARDAKRAEDMDQIYIALNLFYSKYGCLPLTSSTACAGAGAYQNKGAGSWDYSSQTTGTGFLSFLQTSGFMSKVPVDPINNMTGDGTPAGTYAYRYFCYGSGSGSPGLNLGYWQESNGQFIQKNTINGPNSTDSGFSCL